MYHYAYHLSTSDPLRARAVNASSSFYSSVVARWCGREVGATFLHAAA
jgi:hypothetical protein